MDNLHLSVMAMLLCFSLLGSVRTSSQQSLLATRPRSDCWWEGESSLNCSFTGTSAVPEDISQTALTADFSYNAIKSFLCPAGRNGDWMPKHLNLSNNVISELSLTACRNLGALETLNLDGNAIHNLTLVMPVPACGSAKYGKVKGLLPGLKVLSVERNHLNSVPRGLGLLQSLQTVRMSSNSIRQIEPEDFQNCSQLRDISLRNNEITTIHPDAFRDLSKLQVLDLRENSLTTPQLLISLNFFQLEVDLSNNTRMFNCRLNAFKSLFQFLFDSTRRKWSISYNKPANESQKPLLYLSSFRFNCSDGVSLKRAVIPAGRTSVLNCDLCNARGSGVSWWTPKGTISKDNSLPHMTLDERSNLVIHNTERAAEGLYLCNCNTTSSKHLIYNIKVKARVSTVLDRKIRDTNSLLREGRTEQDFTLAVCLSVLITFVCAFCLGAFARPYLVRVWRVMCRKEKPAAEHIYCNQGFSDDTLSRGCSASKPTQTRHQLFFWDENSSRSPSTLPTVSRGAGSDWINTNTSNEEDTEVDDNGLFSARLYSKSRKEVPRKEMSSDISLRRDSKHANSDNSEASRFSVTPGRLNADSYSKHTDSSELGFSSTGEAGFPFCTTCAAAQYSGNSTVSDSSSETTKATPDSSDRKGIVTYNEATNATRSAPGRQSCNKQLGLSSSMNVTGDAGDFISPSRSPLTEYLSKMQRANGKGASADTCGNSSSEGTPFTLSDCSSLTDSEPQPPDVGDNLLVRQSSVAEAESRIGTGKSSTLTESPNVAPQLQHTGRNERKSRVSCEATADCESDTIMSETVPPSTDERDAHASLSDSDTISSSYQELADMFDHFTDAEPTVQNSVSHSLHNPSPDFGNMLFPSKHPCVYDADTESASEEAGSGLYHFPIEPWRSSSFSCPELLEDKAPKGSTDEHTDRTSSEENRGKGDAMLSSNMDTSEDDDFTFVPINAGLNETVKNPQLLHSSNKPPLQYLPQHRITEPQSRTLGTGRDLKRSSSPIPLSEQQHTAEEHVTVRTEKDDLLPRGKQVNTRKAGADVTLPDFNEENCDRHQELQNTSNCSPPEGTWSHNVAADLLHHHSSGKIQPASHTEDDPQWDENDEDSCSFSVTEGFLSEGCSQCSSCSLPQKTTGNITSESTNPSTTDDDAAVTRVEDNSTTATNLQNSGETLRNQSTSAQGQFFVKKKRAFDGFANILQSRRTDFNS